MFNTQLVLVYNFITFLEHNSINVEAKGAIYLTTQNGTFPITLTSLKSPNEATQDTSQILSASVQNDSNHDDWEDRNDELLLSNDINATYEDVENNNVWKRNFKRSINDAVSKNITLVLENLLKNYENSQLPTHGKGNLFFLMAADLEIILFSIFFSNKAGDIRAGAPLDGEWSSSPMGTTKGTANALSS